jgi:hypothetical protein
MATGGGTGRFPAIPDGGAGRGRWLKQHSEMGGDPFGGSGEEGCSPMSPSTVTRSAEVNGGGRGRPRAEGAGKVDGEVHGAAAELEEAEMGPKDSRSGPSAWRRSAVKKEAAPGMAERRGKANGREGTRRRWRGLLLSAHAGR